MNELTPAPEPAPAGRRVTWPFVACLSLALWSCSEDTPSSPDPPGPTPARTSEMVVTSPPRGGMLAGGSPLITANGTACDSTSTITNLTLDGQPVPLTGTPPCLDFTAQLNSTWGLNIIRGSARNQAGVTTSLVQSYLRSPLYAPAAATSKRASGTTAEETSNGLYLQMNQAAADDANRSDADDLATLIHRKLSTTNLNTLMPTTLFADPDVNGDNQVDFHTCDCVWPIEDITLRNSGYRVTRGNVTGSLALDFVRFSESGITIRATLSDFTAPLAVTGYLSLCPAVCVVREPVTGIATGSVGTESVVVTATATVTIQPNGDPLVTICNACISADAEDPWINIDWGPLEFLDGAIGLSNIATSIVSFVESQIERELEGMAADAIAPVLTELIRGFELPPTLTLPPPMNTVLNLTSTFEIIELGGSYPNGYARLGLGTSVTPATPLLAGDFGAIQRLGDVPSFSATEYTLAIGLKDDFLNQLLWASWSGGAFEIDDVSSVDCSLPGGPVTAMSIALPPVIMPGTGGHEIMIGMGDVHISTADVELYASSIMGGTITFDQNTGTLLLTLASDPNVDVQIIKSPANASASTLATQYSAALECILPALLTRIVAAFPVPSPAVGLLGIPGVPAGARWVIGDAAVDRQDSYHALTGSIVVK